MKSIPFSPPDIQEGEINLVVEALRSGWITTGPKTKEFEKQIAKYCGVNKAVALNSNTACSETTLRILGIGEGDEVIVPAYTYTASCSVICHVGATPVMVDVAKDSYLFDLEKLEKAITPKTKAIIAVDLAGVMADYDSIYKIVESKKSMFSSDNKFMKSLGRIAVLADGAHSLGAVENGKKSGCVADFTFFSFHAVKNLTTAEGGAVTWRTIPGVDDEELYKLYMLMSLHGQSKDALHKNQLGAWEYDVLFPGYKCNMTDMAAALGIGQLARYEQIIARRFDIIHRYNDAFKDIGVSVIKHEGENFKSSGHLYLTRVDGADCKERNDIIIKMAEKGVACNVHYKPLAMLTAYKDLGFDVKDYPNAYDMFRNEITLPLNTVLTDEEVEYVIKAYKESVK